MDSRNGTGNRSLQAHGGPVLALAVDPQDRWIATSSTDSLVKIWAFDDFDLVRVLSDPGATILDLEYSPAGDQIASAGSDGAIHVWEAGELTHVFRGHTAAVLDICWSPDGRRLASVSQDGSLRIRDLVAGSERVFPMARSSWVAVAYSADGSRLAVGGLDQAVTLLDPETGRELVSLHGHVAGIVSLVFSPRDEFLVSASNDGTVRIWDSTHASTGAPGSSPLRVGE
jgi:WD40 repeat protein